MKQPMHSLLKRQLKKFFADDAPPKNLQNFINAVNDAYIQSDDDRSMLERSLELSSKELIQANSEMRAVFEALPDLFFRLDQRGTVLDCKTSGLTDLSLRPEQMRGKQIQDIPFSDVGEKFGAAIEQMPTNKKLITIEYTITIQDRQEYYEARLLPLLETQIVVIIRNVTEHKLADKKVKASLQEKEVLLREIHHRVKNNMQVISSLLSLQSTYIEDTETLELFRESESRIRSMALVHEKLYQSKDLADIDIAGYIRNLTDYLLSAYIEISTAVHLKLNIDPISLDVDTAIPCGLIINELVSNAFKHAFKESQTGEINIDLYRNPIPHTTQNGAGKPSYQYTLSIKDNGSGFPEEMSLRNTKSLGLNLVNSLVRQLKGTIEQEKYDGTGFKIQFNSI